MIIYILLCFFMHFVDKTFGISYSYFSDIIILLIFAYYITKNRGRLNINPIFIFCFLILFGHSCYLIFKDTLSEALKGGRMIIFTYLYIIIFYLLIKDGLTKKSIIYYKKNVFLILKINIIFILSEIIINMMGYGYLIKEFTLNYRLDLPSPVIINFINKEFSGPNSVLLTAQTASIISLMGIILFAPFLKGEKMPLESYLWLPLAVICYIASVTTTSLISFATCIIILFYFAKNSKFNKLPYKIIFTGFIIIYYSSIIDFFSYRFADDLAKEYYLEVFLNPIVVIGNFPIIDLLAGVGSSFTANQTLIEYSDFALGVLMIMYGVLIVGFIIILYSIYSIKLIYNLNNAVQYFSEMDSLIIKNYLCTLVVFVSIIHYGTLLMPGMRQLFAFQIALTCVLIMRKKSERLTGQHSLIPNNS